MAAATPAQICRDKKLKALAKAAKPARAPRKPKGRGRRRNG
jgi:hypothetical protein